MGRVRRYKKFKACDPFSKQSKSTVSAADLDHDEPPDIYEDSVKKAHKKRMSRFRDEDLMERQLQKEAMRAERVEQNKKPSEKVNSKKLEGRKEGETMKQFKTRIRTDTRTALRDELKGLTKTSKKNKEFLLTKKYKKRGIERFDINEELIEDGFSSRDDGSLRQSDLGGKDEFEAAENLAFGARMDRPPEFKGVDPLKRKNMDGSTEEMQLSQRMQQRKPKVEKRRGPWADSGPSFGVDDDEAAPAPAPAPTDSDDDYDDRGNLKKKKRKGKKRNICDIMGDSGGGDGGHDFKMKDGYLLPVAGKKGGRSLPRDNDALRVEAQEAYRAIRDKKRKF